MAVQRQILAFGVFSSHPVFAIAALAIFALLIVCYFVFLGDDELTVL